MADTCTCAVEDHETYWGGNEDMKKRTMAYAERAMSAVRKGILTPEKSHPWKENAHHCSWQLRIFELEGDHCNLPNGPLQFENTRDLLMYWESTPKDGTAEKRNRRVVILEDVSARIAELLGVLLDIPPEFFLSHCDEAVELNVVNKQLIKQGSSTYWKVAVPQRRALPQAFWRTYEGPFHTACGSFHRGEGIMQKSHEFVTFRSLVSFWGKSYGAGSWTTVILIDPHLARITLGSPSDSDQSNKVLLENYKPNHDIVYEVMLDSAEDELIQLHERTIFDTVVKAHGDLSMVVDDDPFSATFFARNCIRALWEQKVWGDEWDIRDSLTGDADSHRQSAIAADDFDKKMAADNQTVKAYQELMRKRQNIKSNRVEIRAITRKFRLRGTDYMSTGTQDNQNFMEQEAELWEILDEKLEEMEKILGDHMEMYSVRSAMEETYEAKMQSRESMRQTEEANKQTAAANRMARSSGQLTKIATIVVPCTFVASIFSMGGEFAAGESLFYIYWIISVPVTLGLLCWVIHNDVLDFFQKWSERINLRKRKLNEDSKV